MQSMAKDCLRMVTSWIAAVTSQGMGAIIGYDDNACGQDRRQPQQTKQHPEHGQAPTGQARVTKS